MTKLNKYEILRPFTVEFSPAHLSEERLREKLTQVIENYDYHLTPAQFEQAIMRLNDLADDDIDVSAPELTDDKLLSQGLQLFVQTEVTQRNFLINLFGDMATTDLANYSDTSELKSLVLSDFTLTDTGNFVVFEVVADSDVPLDIIDDYLDGQIQDGWGENGTELRTKFADITDMPKSLKSNVVHKYSDVLISDSFPRVTKYFDENGQFVVPDKDLALMTRMSNNINMQGFVGTKTE